MLHDLRFALRLLRKNPGFTLVAVLVLGLGIGANTAIFSIVNAALLRPLPFRDPDRLVALKTIEPKRGRESPLVAPLDFYAISRESRSLESVVGLQGMAFTLRYGDRTLRLFGAELTPDLYKMLGVEPALGRGFTDSDYLPNAPRVVMLGHDFWQNTFNGDPAILGKQVLIEGEAHTVTGVLGPSFRFPVRVDVSRPFHGEAEARGTARPIWYAFARLKTGVSIEQASAEIDTISQRLAAENPATNAGHAVRLQRLQEEATQGYRLALLIFQAAVGLVLLIACANIGNLLIARAAGRRREMAIRIAIGATGWRLARQLIVESFTLAAWGGAVGAVAASWSMDWLVRRLPVGLSFGEFIIRPSEIRLDAAALSFTTLVTFFTALLFGLAPMFEIRRIADALRGGSRRLQAALVVAEVALALVLMTAAGLLAQSFVHLQNFNPGYNPERLVRARFGLTPQIYSNPRREHQFFDSALERARAVPGVTSAAMINGAPLSGLAAHSSFAIEGRPAPPPDQKPDAEIHIVTPDYFATMQTRVLRGRAIEARDDENVPSVAVISESFAKKWWPGEDPIGARIRVQWRGFDPYPAVQIVGIVADVQYDALETGPSPMLYGSYRQEPWGSLELREIVARTSTAPSAFIGALRKEVRSIDPGVAVYAAGTMTDSLSFALDRPKFAMNLMGLFALVSVALASLGLYGVLACAVHQRTKEFGIRMALGADRARLLRQVIREGTTLAAGGVVVGIAGSIAAARLIASLLVGVDAKDPWTLAAVSLVLMIVAAAASYIPAKRATRVDPMIALREE